MKSDKYSPSGRVLEPKSKSYFNLRPLQLRSQAITKTTSQLQSYLPPLSAMDRTHTHTQAAATRESRERQSESKRERAQTSSRIHRYAQPDPH